MASGVPFRVVVGTDGSRPADAAVITTLAFPWPDGTQVSGVVARRTPSTAGRPGYVIAAWDRHWAHVAAAARRALGRRWPDAAVTIADETPADAVCGEATRRKADVIVLGWRGHGAFRRLLMGSVSRAVVRGAPCSVLVTRRRIHAVRRVVIGIDGSAHARHAVDLLARLAPKPGAEAVVVQIVEPPTLPTGRLVPAPIRRVLRKQESADARERTQRAEKDVAAAVDQLRDTGWKTRGVVRRGAALTELLTAADQHDADLLVVGAQGAGRVERVGLGSVAEGALDRAAMPVLVAR